MRLLIRRDKSYQHLDKQTVGTGYVFNENNGVEFNFATLELPWLDNERQKSCIPDGEYLTTKHVSPKFGDCFWVQNVPSRTAILIHTGNFYYNSKGCVIVGKKHLDINNDGLLDVVSSKDTMEELLSALPDRFTLKIEWA